MYFVVIIGLLLLTVWIGTFQNQNDNYTKGELVSDLENNLVTAVTIRPNEGAPTGSVHVDFTNGEDKVLYATDVTVIEELVREYGIDPVVRDIPRESWFLTYMLPVMVVLIAGVFIFVLINSQNSSGNSGGKMMNFGKAGQNCLWETAR